MAKIKPINGWRYNPDKTPFIEQLISPLEGINQQEKISSYFKEPLNSIHLNLPYDYEKSKKTLDQWKKEKVLVQDMVPGIYVLFQYLPNGPVNKGFIINMYNHNDEENVILRHENTFNNYVGGRLNLLQKTEMNTGPTHGFYTDPEFTLEPYLEESILEPVYEATDHQGVLNRLSMIHDKKVIDQFTELLSQKQVILADGHHRFESSLRYNQIRKASNPNHNGNEGYNYHFMFLVNTEQKASQILPYHRVIPGINIEKNILKEELSRFFEIEESSENTINKKAYKTDVFQLIFKSDTYNLKPKSLYKNISKRLSAFFLLHDALNTLSEKGYLEREEIFLTASIDEAKEYIYSEKDYATLLLYPVTMEEFKDISSSGLLLPQKTTYFYPKLSAGFVFNSIKDEDFNTPFNSCF